MILAYKIGKQQINFKSCTQLFSTIAQGQK